MAVSVPFVALCLLLSADPASGGLIQAVKDAPSLDAAARLVRVATEAATDPNRHAALERLLVFIPRLRNATAADVSTEHATRALRLLGSGEREKALSEIVACARLEAQTHECRDWYRDEVRSWRLPRCEAADVEETFEIYEEVAGGKKRLTVPQGTLQVNPQPAIVSADVRSVELDRSATGEEYCTLMLTSNAGERLAGLASRLLQSNTEVAKRLHAVLMLKSTAILVPVAVSVATRPEVLHLEAKGCFGLCRKSTARGLPPGLPGPESLDTPKK